MGNLTKEELRWQIQSVKDQISQANQELKDLEEKLEVLLEFKGKCSSKVESFWASVQRRKNKLNGISGIVDRMKSAKKYWQTMNGMLTGTDYTSTESSINTLMETLDGQKDEVNRKITETENKIDRLSNRLQNLQYQYDNWKEETVEDG